MAMLRLPTLVSGGANLHRGIGVGVDLHVAGHFTRCSRMNRSIGIRHRAANSRLDHFAMACDYRNGPQVARAVGLGMVGIDIVLDEVKVCCCSKPTLRPVWRSNWKWMRIAAGDGADRRSEMTSMPVQFLPPPARACDGSVNGRSKEPRAW
jgi:hypothetical protein